MRTKYHVSLLDSTGCQEYAVHIYVAETPQSERKI